MLVKIGDVDYIDRQKYLYDIVVLQLAPLTVEHYHKVVLL